MHLQPDDTRLSNRINASPMVGSVHCEVNWNRMVRACCSAWTRCACAILSTTFCRLVWTEVNSDCSRCRQLDPAAFRDSSCCMRMKNAEIDGFWMGLCPRSRLRRHCVYTAVICDRSSIHEWPRLMAGTYLEQQSIRGTVERIQITNYPITVKCIRIVNIIGYRLVALGLWSRSLGLIARPSAIELL